MSLAAYVAEDGLDNHHWEERPLGLGNFICPSIREHKCQSRLLYPAKFSITIDGETIYSMTKTNLHNLSTNSALQRIIDGKLKYKEGNYTLEKARK